MSALLPGIAQESTHESARLLRWLLAGAVFTAVSEIFSATLNANHRVVVPTAMRLVGPVLVILLVLFSSQRLGIFSLVLASLATAALQTIIIVGYAISSGSATYRLLMRGHQAGLTKFLKAALPIILSMLLYRCLPLFDRWFASQLPEGSISVLSYARTLFLAIQPILVSGIALSFYPVMADFASQSNHPRIAETIAKSCRMLSFVSIPIALCALLFSKPLVLFMLDRGSYSHQAALATHAAFTIYVASLPITIIGAVLGQGAYVLKMTRTIAFLGVIETAVYMGVCLALRSLLGLYSVPVAFFVYFNFSGVILWQLLTRRLGHSLLSSVLPAFKRQLVAALVGVAPAYALGLLIPPAWWGSLSQIAFAGIIYFTVAVKLHHSAEATTLLATVREGVKRVTGANGRPQWPGAS